MEEAPIGLLDMLSEKRFQLINVDLEKSGGKWAPLLDSNSALDELRHPSNCAETAKYGLVETHNSSQKGRRDTNPSQPLKEVLPRDRIEGLPEVHKAAIYFGGSMSGLLDYCLKSEDMVGGLVIWSETSLPPGPEMFVFYEAGESPVEGSSIQLGECVSDHDRSVIVRVRSGPYFVDRVDNMVGPFLKETITNDMVEEICKITNQRMKPKFEELCLEAFFVCDFAVV